MPFDRLFFAAVLALASSCATAATAGTPTVYRVWNGDDSGVGNLRSAIASINASPHEGSFVIEFNLGQIPIVWITHDLPEIDRPGQDIIIDGVGTRGLVITGRGAAGLIRARRFGSISIRNLSLSAGKSVGGGCLRAMDEGTQTSRVLVENVSFIDCVAGSEGGGAVFAGNSLKVVNSIFQGNRVDLRSPDSAGGAAIVKRGVGSLEIESSIFHGNTVYGDGSTSVAAKGGAVFIHSAGYGHTIRGSRFTSNRASGPGGALVGQGGAINVRAGELRVDSSYFQGNYASQFGGSIAIKPEFGAEDLPEVVIENSTFESNLSHVGGALSFQDYRPSGGLLTVRNSLFRSNRGAGRGQTIDVAGAGATLKISHTAFETLENSPPSYPNHCTGVAQDHGSNAVSGRASIGCGLSGEVMASLGLAGEAPSLPQAVPVAYALLADSPLLDGGAAHSGSHIFPFTCTTSDARGEARPHPSRNSVFPTCDIGPVEAFQAMFSDGFES
jgi:hypothetical protein